jgi:hypothetical protein
MPSRSFLPRFTLPSEPPTPDMRPSQPSPPDAPSSVVHARVARTLLQRAVLHLQRARAMDAAQRPHPVDDSALLTQAVERLAVAEKLIDAFTSPEHESGPRPEWTLLTGTPVTSEKLQVDQSRPPRTGEGCEDSP